MSKLQTDYIISNKENLDIKDILDILQDMYKKIVRELNKKPDIIIKDSDGSVSDAFLSDGDININSDTEKVEILIAHDSQKTVKWKEI